MLSVLGWLFFYCEDSLAPDLFPVSHFGIIIMAKKDRRGNEMCVG